MGATGVVAGLAVVLSIPVAGAHATPLGFSPTPGSTVGGPIDAYEVLLDQPVIELHSMGLSTEAGTELSGKWSQPAPNLIRFTSDRVVDKPGNYILSYRMTAEDGDTTRSAFVFTFDPDAGPPDPVPAEKIMATPPPRGLMLAGVLCAGAALAGVIILVRRRKAAEMGLRDGDVE
ncbi:MAG: copper resistance protein CopC [Microthrixaceae bacterium]